MALSEIDLARLEKHVGALCRRRSHPEDDDELSVEYRIKGHDVAVYQRWPQRGDDEVPVAKLKLVRRAREWRLYCQRPLDGRWRAYPPAPASRDLAQLVDEIDKDPYGYFFM